MRNPDIALILAAAGVGSRLGGSEPKQFLELENWPLYMWSVVSFGINPSISRIVIVTQKTNIVSMESRLKKELSVLNLERVLAKVSIIEGGASRQESVYKGLLSLEEFSPDFVLVHDAARPFISQTSINRVIEATTEYGAAIPGFRVTDTIKKVEDSTVVSTLDRTELMNAQTPQGSKFKWLLAGHKNALRKSLEVTDDSSILEAENRPVRVVEGESTNIKITVAEDLIIASILAKKHYGQINALIKAKNNLRS